MEIQSTSEMSPYFTMTKCNIFLRQTNNLKATKVQASNIPAQVLLVTEE